MLLHTVPMMACHGDSTPRATQHRCHQVHICNVSCPPGHHWYALRTPAPRLPRCLKATGMEAAGADGREDAAIRHLDRLGLEIVRVAGCHNSVTQLPVRSITCSYGKAVRRWAVFDDGLCIPRLLAITQAAVESPSRAGMAACARPEPASPQHSVTFSASVPVRHARAQSSPARGMGRAWDISRCLRAGLRAQRMRQCRQGMQRSAAHPEPAAWLPLCSGLRALRWRPPIARRMAT